jgi:hypothetical protein
MIHSTIKVIQVLVPEQAIVDHVPLATSIVERIIVALPRKIKPLSRDGQANCRVAKWRLASGWPNSFPSKFKYPSPPSEWVNKLKITVSDETAGVSLAYRIILWRASPREMMGVMGVRSDIFVSYKRFENKWVRFRMRNLHISLSINQNARVLSPTSA